MIKTKLEFLEEYLNETKHADIEDALNSLEDFYDNLPKSVKTKEREDYFCQVFDSIYKAFDAQLELIANCPFVKIEISNQPEQTQDKKILEWCKDSICCIEGYLDALSGDIRRIKQQKEQIQ